MKGMFDAHGTHCAGDDVSKVVAIEMQKQELIIVLMLNVQTVSLVS